MLIRSYLQKIALQRETVCFAPNFKTWLLGTNINNFSQLVTYPVNLEIQAQKKEKPKPASPQVARRGIEPTFYQSIYQYFTNFPFSNSPNHSLV